MNFTRQLGRALAMVMLVHALPADAGRSINYGPIYSNYEMSADKGGGCISGSIGTTAPGKRISASITFASEANANSNFKRGFFGFHTFDKRLDIFSDPLRASVFRMCLKPGRYHLVGIDALGQHNTTRVHVPFEVEAGKHIYMGSFVFHTQHSGSERCRSLQLPLYVEVSDEHERDLPIIMNHENSIGIEPTINVIDPTTGYPYFVSCGSK